MTTKAYQIPDFVSDVLKKAFPGNKLKQTINDDDDKLNFACPYCGDSHDDNSKKRGNLYFKTNSYKCFNDGCLKWTPLAKFISEFAMKYSLEIPNLVEEKETKKINLSNIKRGFLIEFLMNPRVKDSLLDFKELASRFFLMSCKEAPRDSLVGKYIDSRNLRSLPAFEHSCYYDSREDKIYIFNLDLRSGKVLGLSIRRIDDYSGPKYNIKNYSEFKKNGLVSNIDDDTIIKIDTINNYFNILNINFNKPIVVLEGQIDAMFLTNSIATTGVTKSKSILDTIVSKKNALILFDNDFAGKSESFKLLKNGYRVFLWSSLISDLRKKYPKNRRSIDSIKDINNLYNFYVEVGNSMSYDEFNNHILNYFSESIFDLISV